MAELEVEGQNLTIVDNVSNASNLTGREAATPEGIAVTYFSLFLMALGPILVGSLRSVKHHLSLKKQGEEAQDKIGMKDAAMFPVYASGGLFGIYLFFKFIPKEYVNLLLSIFFLALGVSALARACSALLEPYVPAFVTGYVTKYKLLLVAETPDKKKEETKMDFSTVDIILAIMSGGVGVVYFFTKQWILNNIIGLAFCMNAIELISLDTVSVGCLLLGGLFLYDIFWVFGTDVMVTVAKGLEVPIKLVFPMDLLEKGLLAKNFGMLGLGDIVVPGIYIALLCRFDNEHRPGKTRIYFYTGFLSYMIGLGTTVGVMHFFKAAQPALLYLVPSCLGLPFLVALILGDLPALFRYKDYPESKVKEGADKEKEEKEEEKKEEGEGEEKREGEGEGEEGGGEEETSAAADDGDHTLESKKTQ